MRRSNKVRCFTLITYVVFLWEIIALTSPESGRVIHDNPYDDEQIISTQYPRTATPDQMPDETVPAKIPFKEQVIGYAQVTVC